MKGLRGLSRGDAIRPRNPSPAQTVGRAEPGPETTTTNHHPLATMTNPPPQPPLPPTRLGIASDHGGYELKNFLADQLRAAGYAVVDFGNQHAQPEDDYPDFVVPLARAVAGGEVARGVAVCGSGVGAAVAVNKVPGVRACLISDTFSGRQGVEDDDLNIICLGGRVIGHSLAWELVQAFLSARFSGAERHRRRLAKVAALDNS